MVFRVRVRADRSAWTNIVGLAGTIGSVSWPGWEEDQTGGGSFNLGQRRKPSPGKRNISRVVMMRISTATRRIDKEATPGRMKNLRRHSVRGSSIKIIILDKRDYFSKKKWHGISQSGERMGRK
jgi:hypothetical protein